MGVATATMTANAATLNSQDNTQKTEIVRGTVTISAATDTYATGGIACTFAAGTLEQIKSSLPPTYILMWSQPAVGSPNTFLYLYSYNPGSTLANGLMQVWLGLGTGAEYGTGALTNPAADTILFEAAFVRFL